jgi:hypothetical protein
MKKDDLDDLIHFCNIIAIFAVAIFFVAFALTLGYELAEFILRRI